MTSASPAPGRDGPRESALVSPPAAVLLAAGSGSRFHGAGPKLLAEVDGKPVIRWAIDAVLQAGLAGPYVVTGAADLQGWTADAVEVPNPAWRDGIASSLSAGIAAARRDGHEAVVVALADQPRISAEAWRAVASAAGTPIAVATYQGERGHPVRLGSTIWDLLPPAGEEGARAVMRARPELVTEVPCRSGSPVDVDTAEDLDRFNSRTHSA